VTEIEDEEEETPVQPQKWSWSRFLAATVYSAGNVLVVAGSYLHGLDEAINAHVMYREDRTEFGRSVLHDIDVLPSVDN
jgi:hypothetical protein